MGLIEERTAGVQNLYRGTFLLCDNGSGRDLRGGLIAASVFTAVLALAFYLQQIWLYFL